MNDPVTMPDGRIIRDLTDEEYDATYNDKDATLHKIPDDVLADAIGEIGAGESK